MKNILVIYDLVYGKFTCLFGKDHCFVWLVKAIYDGHNYKSY
jgi:hypothetical protein